jgi:adhesin transport system outer membrane protein
MRKKTPIASVLFIALFAHSYTAVAQTPSAVAHATLKEIAQKAVLNSPEVTAKWHNYKAADEEVGVARGGFFPRVDVTAGQGNETLKQPVGNTGLVYDRKNYSRTSYAASLNQMLFDGFATFNEVRRLDKAKLVRYYELLDASENVALEASRAYLDVLRYRFLNDLAEDNYVQHKATFDQLMRRTQSGVGRRVDLEQAGSRLALAEVNLTTEAANLHDVTARYQRLVNSLPPAVVFPPALVSTGIPVSAKLMLETLHKKNPALHSAIENIEAAQYDLYARRAAYSPKLDFRARTDNIDTYQGIPGDRVNNVAELVVTYNIFNGGSDRARERQYMERRNIAIDMREKACRDTRQTALIAFNDVQRLREQSSFLSLQVSLLEKTRDAYRDQYNIGQRTLLDLLDTENELLSARRSAINADSDLTLAYLRTYAGMGTLLEFLGLQKLDAATPAESDLAQVDASQLCPTDPVVTNASNRAALNARAEALLEGTKPQGGLPATISLPDRGLPVPEVLLTGTEGEIAKQVKGWVSAWMAKDFTAYSGFYAPSFTPDGGLSREDWAQLRRSRLATRQNIVIETKDIKVRLEGNDRAFVEFRQVYQSDLYRDTIQKTLEMVKSGEKWLINKETSVPCSGDTVGGCKGGAK